MKLSDFNTEELKQMKQACIDTRAKYDKYEFDSVPMSIDTNCPLCMFSRSRSFTPCNVCPWSVIDNIFHCVAKGKFNTQKIFVRRNRLDRWIKLIDEEIRRRG